MALLTAEDIRLRMRDFVARNDLYQRVEFSDAEISSAMSMVVDKFNAMTPISMFSAKGFPNKFILLRGTIAELLLSEALAQYRNSLTYSDGGLSVNPDDKGQAYLSAAQLLMSEFETYAQNLKIQLNAEAAFGGTGSPYGNLPSF